MLIKFTTRINRAPRKAIVIQRSPKALVKSTLSIKTIALWLQWERIQNENAFKVRTHSKWERIQNENTLKMRPHSKWERIQNENTLKMRPHSKWERIQNERTYAKWERPQNGNTLKMTKQSAIKIQDNSQNTGNPSVNFTQTNFDPHQAPYSCTLNSLTQKFTKCNFSFKTNFFTTFFLTEILKRKPWIDV